MLKIMGIVIFVISAIGWYWTSKRAFNKKNEFGVQVFESFNSVLLFKVTQFLIAGASYIGLLFGFAAFCLGYGLGR
jgi:hypothetical protein